MTSDHRLTLYKMYMKQRVRGLSLAFVLTQHKIVCPSFDDHTAVKFGKGSGTLSARELCDLEP